MDYGIKNTNPYAAAMFKIDLSNIAFASAASAANLTSSILTEIKTGDFQNYGRRTTKRIPNYGMYLKTTTNASYPNDVSPSLQVDRVLFSVQGNPQWRIVVHAFKENDLTSYAAAEITSNTNIYFPVNNFSPENYIFKIWLEKSNGPASLAEVAKLKTYRLSNKIFVEENNGVKDPRVFADKNELQCSWGDLSNLSKKNYESKVDACEPITGIGATNQKIYFGSKDGAPLQFWIAGRETETGEPDPNGNIMCLYQAEAVDQMAFNKD